MVALGRCRYPESVAHGLKLALEWVSALGSDDCPGLVLSQDSGIHNLVMAILEQYGMIAYDGYPGLPYLTKQGEVLWQRLTAA